MASNKCNVAGCNGTVRPGQATCDCCRRKFIMDPVFRVMLKRQGVTPD